MLLVVEDEVSLARALARALADDFDEVLVAHSITEATAMHAMHGHFVEVLLCDVNLPDGDGLDLVAELRAHDRSLGAIVATGLDTDDVAERAVSLGVQGYLHKPYEMNEVRINVDNARRWRHLDRENRVHRDRLERLVEVRTRELERSRSETITRLSVAAEHRDMETSSHLERMSGYAAILARRAGLDADRCEQIRLASPMHDIGKLGIPDHVLMHDGPFDAEQRRIMATHTLLGHQILAGSESPLLEVGATIALTHHEWWDGSGYPRGLAGLAIPIEGRIVAIADVFDALATPRRYKRAFGIDETVEQMRSERGTHFDPELLDLFLDDLDELLFIRAAHPDRDQASPAPVPALSAWNLR
jgi:putative two-component system response regulator